MGYRGLTTYILPTCAAMFWSVVTVVWCIAAASTGMETRTLNIQLSRQRTSTSGERYIPLWRVVNAIQLETEDLDLVFSSTNFFDISAYITRHSNCQINIFTYIFFGGGLNIMLVQGFCRTVYVCRVLLHNARGIVYLPLGHHSICVRLQHGSPSAGQSE